MTKKFAAKPIAHAPFVRAFPFAPQIMHAPEDEAGKPEEKLEDKTPAAEKETPATEESDKQEASDAKNDDGAGDVEALKAEKAQLLREVMDKKSKLRELEAVAADAAKKLKDYEGVDPKKYSEMVKKERETEAAAAEARGDFENVKKMMAEEHTKETSTLQARIAELENTLGSKDKVIDGLTLGSDFGNSAYIKDNLTLSPSKARRLYGDHFEIQDGKSVAYDKPVGAPNRSMLVDASGEPLPFEASIQRIVNADPDKDSILKVKMKPGSASGSTPAQKTPAKKTYRTGVDRIRASFNE